MTPWMITAGYLIGPALNLVGTIVLARTVIVNPGHAYQGSPQAPVYLASIKSPKAVSIGIWLNIAGFLASVVAGILTLAGQ